MNGPEHYAEAERLIDEADVQTRHGAFQVASVLLAEAQVHATLAQAAATIDTAPDEYAYPLWGAAMKGEQA